MTQLTHPRHRAALPTGPAPMPPLGRGQPPRPRRQRPATTTRQALAFVAGLAGLSAATGLALAFGAPAARAAGSTTAPPSSGALDEGMLDFTEFDDIEVTVVDPAQADGAETVLLRPPYTAGAAVVLTTSWDERGHESVIEPGTGEASSSDYVLTNSMEATIEVTEGRPDGSASMIFTQVAASRTYEYSNPDHQSDPRDVSVGNGATLGLELGTGRRSIGLYELAEHPLSDEHREFYESTSLRVGIPVPAESIGVGAIWTWAEDRSIHSTPLNELRTATLVAVDGDRYTVEVTFGHDLADIPSAEYSDWVTGLSGTASGTVTVEGSVSDPLDFVATERVSYDTSVTDADGEITEMTGTSTREDRARPSG